MPDLEQPDVANEARPEFRYQSWPTAYDEMKIPRVKGSRREVRRLLAEESRRLLEAYRAGHVIQAESCLLLRALGDDKAP